MDKAERRYAALVLDTNVVIAAHIREQGFNRYIGVAVGEPSMKILFE